MTQVSASPPVSGNTLAQRYRCIREFSEQLSEPLSAEDCAIQSMPDVSPTRWHLAHTPWFFETLLLSQQPNYRPFDESFAYLFNSYYNTIGEQYPRARRGMITRPALAEVIVYRRHVDDQLMQLLASPVGENERVADIVEIGLQHEQQHQELILTDIKHVLAQNPLRPVYRDGTFARNAEAATLNWDAYSEGIYWTGHDTDGFCFDNEMPHHREFVESFQLADRLVTCGEYLHFMEDGGYSSPEHWLSLGWDTVCSERWESPLYWYYEDGRWFEFTLAGPVPVDPARPVTHVSYFEADAFARWASLQTPGVRLPTEAEWEVAAADAELTANFADRLWVSNRAMHPQVEMEGATGLVGNAWQWTSSPYTAYPGYQASAGALGEYNGKFMCNQFVLRGGSCATSSSHIRTTYRNFFPPSARWQFTGIRLCR